MAATVNPYAKFLREWPKAAGPKPTEKEFKMAESLKLKAGRKNTCAAAMYFRKEGASTEQVSKVLGGPQLNVKSLLVARGLVVPHDLPTNDDGHKVYKISLKTQKPARAKSKKSTKKQELAVQELPKQEAANAE